MPDDPPEKFEQIEARVVDLVIRLLLLGLFAWLSLAMIRPFLAIIGWAIILAVALAPAHEGLARILGGRRRLAALLLALAMLAVVIGPVAALSTNLVESVYELVARTEGGHLRLPDFATRLQTVPVFGQQIHDFWITASASFEAVILRYHQILTPLGTWLIKWVSALGFDLLRFVVSILLAGLLLVPGPKLAVWGRRFAARILAPRGEKFVDLATVTVRNVSRGVVGVALLQAILIGLVLLMAGVPGAGLLTMIILILCILQVGPLLIVLPVLVWAWVTFPTAHALLLTVALVPLNFMDSALKPMLMGRGLSTPTLVIFMGVIGGTLSFGLIGLFLGPVVLAVFYDLLMTWLLHDPEVSYPPQIGQ